MNTTGRDAFVVCDLGFGDAGKGTITDWLVRRSGARLVVRYNGGAQAGHTVVLSDGRHHTFAQIGAGSFVAGVRTHLSRFMVVHPTGLLVEAERLRSVGVPDVLGRLSIAPEARVITPFHQAAGRLRELARGALRHGSCGVGLGEAVADFLEHPRDTVTVGDLWHRAALGRKLARVQERKRAELEGGRAGFDKLAILELEVLDSTSITRRWMDSLEAFTQQVSLADDALPAQGSVIFEGAHGVLLDERYGFHPHTTWSTCTFENALEILRGWNGPVVRLGVLRTYATRHGVGPFPTEDPALRFDEPHNPAGPWQGPFRLGWPDAVLGRYALAACGHVDGLALTHVDRLGGTWRLATAYRGWTPPPRPSGELSRQEALGRALATARPLMEELPGDPGSFLEALEHHLGAPVLLTSHGPRPEDKRETHRPYRAECRAHGMCF